MLNFTFFHGFVHSFDPADQMIAHFITRPLLVILKLHSQNLLKFCIFFAHVLHFRSLVW